MIWESPYIALTSPFCVLLILPSRHRKYSSCLSVTSARSFNHFPSTTMVDSWILLIDSTRTLIPLAVASASLCADVYFLFFHVLPVPPLVPELEVSIGVCMRLALGPACKGWFLPKPGRSEIWSESMDCVTLPTTRRHHYGHVAQVGVCAQLWLRFWGQCCVIGSSSNTSSSMSSMLL